MPGLTAVVCDIPIVVLDLQLRSHAILAIDSVLTILSIFTIGSILAIRSVLTRSTVSSILTGSTVLSVGACRRDLAAVLIQKPFTIQSPVILAVGILLHAYHRSPTILAICTILTISTILAGRTCGSILAMIDRYGIGTAERNRVADLLAAFHYRSDPRHIIIHLQSFDKTLKGCYVGVHLLAKGLQRGDSLFMIFQLGAKGFVIITRR